MSLLNILQYPDPRLKKIARPINISEIGSQTIKTIIADMFETMYQAKGIGLAATQVNLDIQLIVIDLSEQLNMPQCLINPSITSHQDTVISEEGCLSFPGVYAKVKRHKNITVEFLDQFAQKNIINADNLLSICIQHEIDHLRGITFFDHLSLLKKSLLEKKLKKLRNHNL